MLSARDEEAAFQRRPRGTRTSRRREIKVPLILSGSLVSEGALGGPLLGRPGLDQSCRALLAGPPVYPYPQSPPPSASSTHFSHSPSFCPFSPSPISFKGMFVVLPCLPPLFLSFQSVHNPQTIAKRNKRSVIHKTTYFPQKNPFASTASIVN